MRVLSACPLAYTCICQSLCPNLGLGKIRSPYRSADNVQEIRFGFCTRTSSRREENGNTFYSFLFSLYFYFYFYFSFHRNMCFGGETASIQRSPLERLTKGKNRRKYREVRGKKKETCVEQSELAFSRSHRIFRNQIA